MKHSETRRHFILYFTLVSEMRTKEPIIVDASLPVTIDSLLAYAEQSLWLAYEGVMPLIITLLPNFLFI
jgi:hypothetical protein